MTNQVDVKIDRSHTPWPMTISNAEHDTKGGHRLRQLPDHHHHAVEAQRERRAGLQRVRTLPQAPQRELRHRMPT